jgi:hypothetical protein
MEGRRRAKDEEEGGREKEGGEGYQVILPCWQHGQFQVPRVGDIKHAIQFFQSNDSIVAHRRGGGVSHGLGYHFLTLRAGLFQ